MASKSNNLQKVRRQALQIATLKNENLDEKLEVFYDEYVQENFDYILNELSSVKKKSNSENKRVETKDKVSALLPSNETNHEHNVNKGG